MTIDLINEHPVWTEDPELLERIRGTVRRALKEHGAYEDIQVTITLTDDENIHRLNREFRDVDRATDVLSFPMLDYYEDYEEPDDEEADMESGEDEEVFDPDTDPESGELLLGDIVVSLDTSARQAEEYGHSFEREVCFLVCHGMLHLLGYDHIEPEDERIMIDMQKRIMAAEGLER